MKKIFKIVLIILIAYLYYKNGFADCAFNLADIEYKYREILFEDLREFVDTNKFKVLKGYQKDITDEFLWDFVKNLDIMKLLSETENEQDIKQKTREKFCEYIIRMKNKDFYFFISSLAISIFTQIGDIIENRDNILNFGPGLHFGIRGRGRFLRDFFMNLDFHIYRIIYEYYQYFLILFLMLTIPYLFHPYCLDIPSLIRDHFNLSDLLPYKKANPFFFIYDYTNTAGIIDKDLLSNIKKFFIPKQKGIF